MSICWSGNLLLYLPPSSLQASSYLVTRKRNWPCTFGQVDSQASRSFLGGATDESMAPVVWCVGRGLKV